MSDDEDSLPNYRVSFPFGEIKIDDSFGIPSDLKALIEKASIDPDPLGFYIFAELTNFKHSYKKILKCFESLEEHRKLFIHKPQSCLRKRN